jgi:DNA-binding transcriptional regulator YdaS (Cro superfamily)
MGKKCAFSFWKGKSMEALNKWFKQERGRKSRLTEHLGLSSGALSQWQRVPAERVRKVSRFTQIPMHLLRPDLYKDVR